MVYIIGVVIVGIVVVVVMIGRVLVVVPAFLFFEEVLGTVLKVYALNFQPSLQGHL